MAVYQPTVQRMATYHPCDMRRLAIIASISLLPR